jgi:hypothetical protein
MSAPKKSLVGCMIGIELISGERVFGRVSKWSKLSIWLIRNGSIRPIEVPRDIIIRSMVLLSGAEDAKNI